MSAEPVQGRAVLEADLAWTGRRFEPEVRIELGSDGRIAAVGPRARPTTLRLARRALLPGFVDAHSHAFQRGLRGLGERFPAGAGSFWSWREAMYTLVDALDADALRVLTTQAFREMLAAGITSVGEFHYLHHAEAEGGGWELDQAVLEAARDTGIRLVLLQVYYRTGGPNRLLEGAQRRFDARSFEAYWKRMDELARGLDPARVTLGCAPHSLRALAPDELARVAAEARARDMVVHMHLEETKKEIEEVRAAFGRTPLELVLERAQPDASFTAVHGTHSEPARLAELFERGATLCLCPTTEANLGDGLPRLDGLAGARLALGTDSNARISMLEELRWAEYGQRLRREQRGALADGAGEVARGLLQAATAGGARALGLPAGALEAGRWADFVLVDLDAPALAGWNADTLAEALVFGAGDGVLASTWVGGRELGARTR